jgi:hypothetical protein
MRGRCYQLIRQEGRLIRLHPARQNVLQVQAEPSVDPDAAAGPRIRDDLPGERDHREG